MIFAAENFFKKNIQELQFINFCEKQQPGTIKYYPCLTEAVYDKFAIYLYMSRD